MTRDRWLLLGLGIVVLVLIFGYLTLRVIDNQEKRSLHNRIEKLESRVEKLEQHAKKGYLQKKSPSANRWHKPGLKKDFRQSKNFKKRDRGRPERRMRPNNRRPGVRNFERPMRNQAPPVGSSN